MADIISSEALPASYAWSAGMTLPAPKLGEIVLPATTDEVERDFGLDVYEKLANEPCLYASDWLLRALVLEPGLQVVGAIAKPPKGKSGRTKDAKRYAQSEAIAEFIRRDLVAMANPTIQEVLWHALHGYGIGHRLCEQVDEVRKDVDGVERVFTRSMRPKGRRSYRFVIDRFGDLLGAQPSTGEGMWTDGQAFLPGAEALDPSRFILFSFNGKDGDPRGKPAYRATYDAWYRKLQAKPEHVKMLVQFGGGRISAQGPALLPGQVNEMEWTTPTGQRKKGPIQLYVVEVLKGFAAGGVCALPPGWTITMHQPPQAAGVFDQAFALLDREMVLAYLKVVRATMEAQHGSKADSGDAVDLLNVVVGYLRGCLCSALKRQYAYRRVALNFGEEAARQFTPDFSLEKPRDQDVLKRAQAATALMQIAKTPEQVNYVESEIAGMPESDGIREDASEPKEGKAEPEFADGFDRTLSALWKRGQRVVDEFRSGETDRETFLQRMLTALAEAHRQAAIYGKRVSTGKRTALTDDEQARLAEILQGQNDFLERFADRIQENPEGSFDANAKMYFLRTRGTSNEFFERTSPEESTFTWDLGGNENHCLDCPYYASLSPYRKGELGWYPGSCDSDCLTSCKCSLVRDDGVSAPGPISL